MAVSAIAVSIASAALAAEKAGDAGPSSPTLSFAPAGLQKGASSADYNGQTLRGMTDLPVPDDAMLPQEGLELWLGASRLETFLVTSRNTSEALQAFFLTSLPTEGWDVRWLPWQARNVAMLQQFQQWQIGETDPRQRQVLGEHIALYQATQKSLAKTLYAQRGTQRLIVDLEKGEAGTLIYFHRWEAPVKNDESDDSLPAWLGRNVLCNRDAVPGQEREWADFVPAYPASRTMSKTIGQNTGDVTILALLADEVKVAQDLYARKLEREGWQPTAEYDPVYGNMGSKSALIYHRGEERCAVFLSPLSASPETDGYRTVLTLVTMSKSRQHIVIERKNAP